MNGVAYSSASDLKDGEAVLDAWVKVGQVVTDNLINSMPNRIVGAVYNKGNRCNKELNLLCLRLFLWFVTVS